MKQNIRTKWFALTLTAALALTTLTACGNGAGTASLPETPGTSAPLLEESGGVAGTVLRERRRGRHRPAEREPGDRDGL